MDVGWLSCAAPAVITSLGRLTAAVSPRGSARLGFPVGAGRRAGLEHHFKSTTTVAGIYFPLML